MSDKPREIKFRAWNLILDQMVSWEKIQDACGLDTLINDKDYILEQYTGLHDKQGKEIYEGDVLRAENLPCQIQKAELICKVIFGFGSFGAEVIKVLKWEKYREPSPEKGNVLWFLDTTEKEIEVIGDMHENPELLEGEK